MKVAIVGSRNWTDYAGFLLQLPDVGDYDTIISGGAAGVDAMAKRWAERAGLAYIEFHVNQHIPSLGFTRAAHARNQQIVDACDHLIAMPGPESKGTWDTIRRARACGIPVTIVTAPM